METQRYRALHIRGETFHLRPRQAPSCGEQDRRRRWQLRLPRVQTHPRFTQRARIIHSQQLRAVDRQCSRAEGTVCARAFGCVRSCPCPSQPSPPQSFGPPARSGTAARGVPPLGLVQRGGRTMQPPQVYGWAQCSIVPLPNEASVQQARSKDLYIYIYIIVTTITISSMCIETAAP
jgi:hypothetical protein